MANAIVYSAQRNPLKKMKVVTKYSLCVLVSIGLACATHAKQDDEKEQKDNGKPDKVEAVENKGRKDEKADKDKKDKVPIVEGVRDETPAPGKPFSVPDAGSTVAFLGLAAAALGLARARFRSSASGKSLTLSRNPD